MRNILLFALIIMILHMNCCQGVCQQPTEDSDLGSYIEKKSIIQPLSLPKWYPPKPQNPFIPNPLSLTKSSTTTSSGSSSSISQPGSQKTQNTSQSPENNIDSYENLADTSVASSVIGIGSSLPLVIGSMVLSAFLSKRPLKDDIPEIIGKLNNTEASQMENDTENYDFKYGEEINFNLILKSKNDSQLKSDGQIIVKLPIWLQYVENSSKINEKYFSDKVDNDSISYLSDDAMIIINLDNIDKDKELSFSFSTKVLTQTISQKEAFCMVKYVAKNGKSESKWEEVSIFKDK